MSVHYNILTAAKTVVESLGLRDWNSAVVPVAVRKLPRADEELDTLPLFCVCPGAEPEQIEPAAMEGWFDVTYPVEVVAVAPGNRDFSVTHLEEYTNWREAIQTAFAPTTLANVGSVWDTEVDPEPVLDRGKLNENYDYGGMVIRFTSREQRGN